MIDSEKVLGFEMVLRHRTLILLLEILAGIVLNIILSYLIIPRFTRRSVQYYNIDDIYIAIYVGLILSACQLLLIFFGVLIIL